MRRARICSTTTAHCWGRGLIAEVWVPEAARLGLRYIAHTMKADRALDILPRQLPATAPFELQVFYYLADAQQWLAQVLT